MCSPSVRSIRPAAMALVGLPTNVPSPPSEAAKAIPIITAPGKPSVSPSRAPAAPTTASAIGTMMSAVDVLEMNMLSSAVAAMKAKSSPVAVGDARLSSASASRRCSPTRSIASARKAPPRIRNRIGE